MAKTVSPVCHSIVRIAGMTCASCELLLERSLRTVPGVRSVRVHHKKGVARLEFDPDHPPSQERIASVIREAGYDVRHEQHAMVAAADVSDGKWVEIGASLLIIFALSIVLRSFNLVALAPSTTGLLSMGGVLLIGLVAGTGSCLAVTGGLLLSMAAKYNEVHAAQNTWQKFVPLLQFNIGRLISYFVLGGFVGLLGTSIALGIKTTGVMTIVVAFVMLYLALTMLQIIPKGSLPIRLPKRLAHRIASLSESRHPAAPFALGALTFFLPCGFTQSLQLAALASGSFVSGAWMMGIFALGTLPALLGISAVSATARGGFSRLFLRFSGTLVLVLALFNLQSGIALIGIDLGDILARSPVAGEVAPVVIAGVQEVRMVVQPFAFEPSTLTIAAGVPVRWVIDGFNASGCTSSIVIPDLRISKMLTRGENIIEFTAPQRGTLAFSCGMGMVRGRFSVL